MIVVAEENCEPVLCHAKFFDLCLDPGSQPVQGMQTRNSRRMSAGVALLESLQCEQAEEKG